MAKQTPIQKLGKAYENWMHAFEEYANDKFARGATAEHACWIPEMMLNEALEIIQKIKKGEN
jgi:hypothetical protein